MKLKGLFIAALLSAAPSAALAQAQNSGVVIDLRTFEVLARFDVGEDPGGVIWTTTSTAFVINGNSVRKFNFRNPARPVATASVAPIVDPDRFIGVNTGDAATSSNGGRLYVANAMTVSTSSAVMVQFDTSRRPIRNLGMVAPPTGVPGAQRIEALALYRNDRAAIMTAGTRLLFADIVNDQFTLRSFPFPTTDTIDPMYPPYATGIALVNTATAVITNYLGGGIQAFNYATLPPRPIGGVVAPDGCYTSPSLALIPEAITGLRQPRLATVLCPDNPTTVGIVNLGSTSTPTPSLDHVVRLASPTFDQAAAMVTNPVNGEIYVASNTTFAIIQRPWTMINRTVSYGITMNLTRAAIGVSPDGRYAVVVGFADF